MTMITPSYLGETIEYSSLHACRSTLEDPTGKCSTPAAPSIVVQPQSRIVSAGGFANFTTTAAGSSPLSYQWSLNGASLPGATNSELIIASARFEDAGEYNVIVLNAFGSITSSNATLMVQAPSTNCVVPPVGLASLWKGEGDATDSVGNNAGILNNGVGFGTGEVGRAFVLNGTSQYVEIPNSPTLNPSGSFSIEAWINPTQSAAGAIFSKWGDTADYGDKRSFILQTTPGNGLVFGISDLSHQWTTSFHLFVTTNGAVPLNTWSHVAAVYDQSTGTRKIYLNGVEIAERTDPPITVLNSDAKASIGARLISSSAILNQFAGSIDEVSFYGRALTDTEIVNVYNAGNAGKCETPVPPLIVAQPPSQIVNSGTNVTLTVGAAGGGPLNYQWFFDGTGLPGSTNSILNLINAQAANSGNYYVIVTTPYGSVTSSNATLNVLPPPSILQADNASALSGIVVVPIKLIAQGTENSVAFSLNFNPAILNDSAVTLGAGAADASLIIDNTNQLINGRLGLAISLPADSHFSAGTQELVRVTFRTLSVSRTAVSDVFFGDQPVLRQVVNSETVLLDVVYRSGTITVPFLGYEGDVLPRPGGDNFVATTDWLQIGRYVVGLDFPTNSDEFIRADCAPRATSGDGLLTVSDWVQSLRYAAGVDPLTGAGGPMNNVNSTGAVANSSSRKLRLPQSALQQGQTFQVAVQLTGLGDENALGFSLNFDPTVIQYTKASLTTGTEGAILELNLNRVGSGNLGVAFALPLEQTFAVGTNDLLTLSFTVLGPTSTFSPLSFGNIPAISEISGTAGSPLNTQFIDGGVSVVSRSDSAPFPPLIYSTINSEGTLNLSPTTRDSSLILAAASERGTSVWISLAGEGIIGTSDTDTNGNWTFDLHRTLPDGTYTFSAVSRNSSGSMSPPSDDFAITIDTQPPAAPSGLSLVGGQNSGDVTVGYVTTNTMPIFIGTAETNSTVSLISGSVLLGTARATDGTWRIASQPLTIGAYHVLATATDDAGNVSVPSNELTVTVKPSLLPFGLSQFRRDSNGQVEIVLDGPIGLTYVIQVSNDLQIWRDLKTVTTTIQSARITDDSAQPSVFYRAARVP